MACGWRRPRCMRLYGAVVGLAAACRTIQLVDARDGSPRPATDVIDPTLLPAAEAIGPTLEGKTERQKNPHLLRSLAWLSWIIARLGVELLLQTARTQDNE